MDKSYKIKIDMYHKVITSLLTLLFLLLDNSNSYSQSKSFSIVKFVGNGTIQNISKSVGQYITHVEDQSYLLAEEGDIFYFSDEYYENGSYFIYRDKYLNKYAFHWSDHGFYINDKLYGYIVSDDDSIGLWYNQLLSEDISDLEFISIPLRLHNQSSLYLDSLSNLKQGVGIIIFIDPSYDDENEQEFSILNKDLMKSLQKIRPQSLYSCMTFNDINKLSGFSDLEFLDVVIMDTLFTQAVPPLPKLPKLKQVAFSFYNPNIFDDEIRSLNIRKLFVKNPQVERLSFNLIMKDSINLSFMRPLNRIRSICIEGENLRMITSKKNLNTDQLAYTNTKFVENNKIKSLKKVKWLSIPDSNIQFNIDNLHSKYPELEIVTIANQDLLNNLAPLLNLPKLNGMIVFDTLSNTSQLLEFKNLDYLSLPGYLKSDNLYLSELGKSLPHTTITFNENFGNCMCISLIMLVEGAIRSIGF